MSIPESFQSLVSRIAPLQRELDEAKGHADSIRARLQKSFNLKKFVVVGSHSRETAIRRYSDVDHFAVFSRDEFRIGDRYKRSDTVLNSLRDDLAQRFRQTSVQRDGPAVVVSFGQGDYSVDVVPAMFWEMNKDNWPIYYIPDGTGGWRSTDNNTTEAANTIPEFQEIAYPILGLTLMVVAGGYRRRGAKMRPLEPADSA